MSDQKQLLQDIAGLTLRPAAFVRYAFKWGTSEIEEEEPRAWQQEVLDYLEARLQDPATRYDIHRVAVASGHGIGKSTLISWILAWGLSTMEDCRCIVTAGTGAQLGNKTVPEVTKWFHRLINGHWWEVRKQSISSRVSKHDQTWRVDFQTWNEQNAQAFAGLHNKRKRIVVVFDEGSIVARPIWEVIEGAMTDEDTQIIWLVFGNPESSVGRFYECFTTQHHLWKTWQIDARTVPGTNKKLFAQWAEVYGEDSAFFKIRVRGEFVPGGIDQLIPLAVVDACRAYHARGYDQLPKVMGVDVARFGDDRSVVVQRQGRYLQILGKFRGLDTEQLADKVMDFISDEKPDVCVVDGVGLGAGVVDKLRHRGYRDLTVEFLGSAQATKSVQYFNKRSESWGLMAEALKAGAEIPQDPELVIDLTGPMYGYNSKQQLQLESKDDMRARGVMSPDIADAFAMTYGVRLALKSRVERVQPEHDVFSDKYDITGDGAWM